MLPVPAEAVVHCIPWFTLSKLEPDGSTKVRLILDCRTLNQYFAPTKFRMDHWGVIFPYLRKGWLGGKIDLKHAYFHVPLSQSLKPYICIQVGEKYFQLQSASFGISSLPMLWQKLMQTFQRLWHKKGLLTFIYLDDILVLANSSLKLQKDLDYMVECLQAAGLTINLGKSVLHPSQQLVHLGFLLDLKGGVLLTPEHKLKDLVKHLLNLKNMSEITPRKLSVVLGILMSHLMAMPLLRAFSDSLVIFLRHHVPLGWDKMFHVQTEVKDQVSLLLPLVKNWEGRPFQGPLPKRILHTDSSDFAWAGVDNLGNQVQDFWRADQSLHIIEKKVGAAVKAIKALAHKGEHLRLAVDNTVAQSYLKKGGGEDSSSQQLGSGLVFVDPVQKGNLRGSQGHQWGVLGRRPLQVGRSWRLHPERFPLSLAVGTVCPRDMSKPGRLRQSRQCTTASLHKSLASPRGHLCRRPELRPQLSNLLLCEPTLDSGEPMVTQTASVPLAPVRASGPLLGLLLMDAPVAENVSPRSPSVPHQALPRDVQQLSQRVHPGAQVAPSLCSIIRGCLQGQQISTEAEDHYLASLGDLTRYHMACRNFRAFCSLKKLFLTSSGMPSQQQVAAALT